jgi:hypothetical protein
MADENDSKYTVGYRRPPKHTQFKPGQSGNAKGRPRKSRTFADDLETELRSMIEVSEGGKRRRITKRRAIAKQHVNKALRGDVRSIELLFKTTQQGRPGQQDNLNSLIEEFRKKNRSRTTHSMAEEAVSIGPADNTASADKEGEKS